MFRDKSDEPYDQLVFKNNFAGLGDFVCRLPAIKELCSRRPRLTLHLFVPDYVLKFHQYVMKVSGLSRQVLVYPMSVFQDWIKGKELPVGDFKPWTFTSLKMHLVDHAWVAMLDELTDDLHKKSYLELPEPPVTTPLDDMDPGPYVTVNVGFTALVKAWNNKEIEDVSHWLRQEGFTPVFLASNKGHSLGGLTEEERQVFKDPRYKPESRLDLDTSMGIDLRGETDLLQTWKILSGAKAHVGIEGGLTHLAAMTDIPIVAGYTFREPKTTLPIRKGKLGYKVVVVEPDKDLACRYCQSRGAYMFGHDYRACYYKDYLCKEQMRASKFIAGLREALQVKGPGARQP